MLPELAIYRHLQLWVGKLTRAEALRHQRNYSMRLLILYVYQVYGHICLRYDVQSKHIYVTFVPTNEFYE